MPTTLDTHAKGNAGATKIGLSSTGTFYKRLLICEECHETTYASVIDAGYGVAGRLQGL
jgi:hypothetical protein